MRYPKKFLFSYCNNILWWSILKKNILLVYHSASFCFQGLLMTSKLHLRELEKSKHWILSLSYIFLSLFLPPKRRLKRSEWFLWELNQKRSKILNLIRNILQKTIALTAWKVRVRATQKVIDLVQKLVENGWESLLYSLLFCKKIIFFIEWSHNNTISGSKIFLM